MTSRTTAHRLRDGTLVVEAVGRGPTLLCLHGLSANRSIWRQLAERLAPRYRVVMPDLLSRGESDPRPDVGYSLGEEWARVRELAALPDLAPSIVIGHSQGAALGLALAASDDAVAGLVLINPVTPWTVRPAVLELLRAGLIRRTSAAMFRPLRRSLGRRILLRACGPGVAVDEEMVRAYCEPFADPRRTRALMRLLADWRPDELADHLPSRSLPIGIVAGDRDPRITEESTERLAGRLGATLHRVPGGAHALPEQVPDLIARVVDEVHEQIEREGHDRAK